MPFPASERVIYRKNPLQQVVCELRYPPILRIETEVPAAFQERIRATYPLFKDTIPLQTGLPPEILKLLPSGIPLRANRVYEFSSEDGFWRLTITKEAVALGCHQYRRWEEFKAKFVPAVEALCELYQPSFFLRIGLRYTNLISRVKLNLQAVGWKDLVKEYIAPEMSTPIAPYLIDTEHTLIVRLDGDKSRVRIYHGIAKGEANEEVYLIDNDFFSEEKTEVNDAIQRLDEYNKESGHLFRWCIGDRLHRAMEPEVIAA